jgi:hypothetical protein
MTTRREFITLLSGAAVAWPLVARAQQGDRIWRIGYLTGGDENNPLNTSYLSAFTQAFAGLGWTDGRNVRLDLRWGGGDAKQVRALAQESVVLKPDIIVASGNLATLSLHGPGDLVFDLPDELADLVGGGLGLQAQDAHLQGPHTVVLQRASRERPCRRAAERGDEFAPPNHSITSSASASSL